MQVSTARLNTIRGALVVALILNLAFGLFEILFPGQLLESFMPGTALTPMLQILIMELGSMAVAWGVAVALALRDPLRHPGLIQAILAFLVIFSVVQVYMFFAVPHGMPVSSWSNIPVTVIVAVVLGIAYPWGQTRT